MISRRVINKKISRECESVLYRTVVTFIYAPFELLFLIKFNIIKKYIISVDKNNTRGTPEQHDVCSISLLSIASSIACNVERL